MAMMKKRNKLLEGHWYHENGELYDGTLESFAQAKELQLIPSVTTILKTLSKPELEDWIIRQRDKAWHELERMPGETLKDATQRVNALANKKSTKARTSGSYIHKVGEHYWKSVIDCKEYKPLTDTPSETELAVQDMFLKIHGVLNEEFPGFWPKNSESKIMKRTPFPYAGTCDLVGLSKDERLIVFDFKTKGKDSETPFKPYVDHWLQLAAYGAAINKFPEDIPGAIILIEPNDLTFEVFIEFNLMTSYYDLFFENLVELFYKLNFWGM